MADDEPVSSASALIDLRPEEEFLIGHFPGAVSFPREQLPVRSHELPPADRPLQVTDASADRARDGAEWLRRRGHRVEIIPFDLASLTESGPGQTRLWQPNPFLVEALKRIGAPSRGARALDVACGSGRDAVHLALAGWNVLAIDVLSDALARARDLARRNGVEIATIRWELEANAKLPDGQFDLITVFRYLHRPLFAALREATASGGCIVCETFHRRTLETGRPPRNPAHLLETGELARAFEDFEIIISRDAAEREGRYVSSLLARRR